MQSALLRHSLQVGAFRTAAITAAASSRVRSALFSVSQHLFSERAFAALASGIPLPTGSTQLSVVSLAATLNQGIKSAMCPGEVNKATLLVVPDSNMPGMPSASSAETESSEDFHFEGLDSPCHGVGCRVTEPPSTSSAAAAGPPPRIKSAKRRAAEALLASRYQGSHSQTLGFSPSVGLQPLGASATPAAGSHLSSPLGLGIHPQALTQHDLAASGKRHCSSSAAPPRLVKGCPPACESSSSPGWCHFDVKIPQHVDWQAVFDQSPTHYTTFMLSKGYQKLYMPGGLTVLLVENPRCVEDALKRLRQTMMDRVVAIDLEWKPDNASSAQPSPVALMQLASATCCVLIRTSSMNYHLPEAVKQFLMDPSLTVVGFSWDMADEAKMMNSFSFGRSRMKHFFDLQAVAHDLGYHRYGLARITKQVMGYTLQKSKHVSCSNWATRDLSLHQIKYAALDVFVTGQVFRGLRLWHSSQSPCSSCQQPVGAVLPFSKLTCPLDGQQFPDLSTYHQHCSHKHHPLLFTFCGTCGRVRSVPNTNVNANCVPGGTTAGSPPPPNRTGSGK